MAADRHHGTRGARRGRSMVAWIVGLALVTSAFALALVPPSAQAAGTLTITSPTTLPGGLTGRAYSFTFSASNAVGPVTWMTYAPLLAGMTLSSTGVLSGIPTEGGDRWMEVYATDGSGQTVTKLVNLLIDQALQIYATTTSPPDVPTGRGFEVQFDSSNLEWQNAEVWSVAGGSLPPGTELTSDGRLRGTPTLAGSFTFTLQVATATEVATASVTQRVYAPTVPTPPTLVHADNEQVSWGSISSDGGTDITGYTVTAYVDGTAWATHTIDGYATSYRFPGLVRATSYTYTVRALNAVGASDESAPSDPEVYAGAPDAPTGVVAVRGDRSATVTWTAPFDGGAPITSYRVHVTSQDGIDRGTIDTRSAATTWTVPGLSVATAYTFTVSAWSYGEGPASASSEPVTPYGPAGPPTGVSASPGDRQAVVRWTAPANVNLSPISAYLITPIADGVALAPVSVSSSTRSKAVTGLVNGTTYTFTVAAVNEAGPSSPSAASNAVVASATPIAPSAPGIGLALPANAAAKVSWTAPQSTGGSTITGYVVTPFVDGIAGTPQAFASTATTHTVTGLVNGTTYTFRVQAVNAVGAGDPSAESGSVTAGAPNAPGFVSVQPGQGSAKVAWMAPSTNGTPITGYVVTPLRGGSIAEAPQTFSTTATSVVVTGLDNDWSYRFEVAAISSAGRGTWSERTALVDLGTPTAPGFVNAVPGSTSARISWTASAPNGYPVSTYVVEVVHRGVAEQQLFPRATSLTVDGLVSGEPYAFRVWAANARGLSPASMSATITVGSPAPPGFQSASPGVGSAHVRFTLPAPNSAPITSYTVWPVQGGTVLAPRTYATPSATDLLVTGLTDGASYTFRVAATNAVGMGPYATTNAVVVGTPVAPAFPRAKPGDASATVMWNAPGGTDPAVTSYVVTPYAGSVAKTPQTVAGTATSATVTGLDNGTTYTFRVAGLNARGTGLVGVTTAVKVGTPTAPSWPSVKPGSASASVSAQPAAANGSPITSYVVTPMLGAVARPAQVFAGPGTSWTVTGLVDGTTYTFRIVAVNAVGTSDVATTAAVTIGVPGQVTGAKAAAGAKQATVSWVAPAANASPITAYVVTPYIGSVAQAPRTFDATATSRIVTGLIAGVAYTFKVQAVNAVGIGAPSAASGPTTPT